MVATLYIHYIRLKQQGIKEKVRNKKNKKEIEKTKSLVTD